MIALVPARGGSKGLPGKNLLSINGHPLVGNSVRQALDSKFIEEVYISTDDPLIEQCACEYGAISLGLRPEALATDTALANDTYRHIIELIEQSQNSPVKEIVILQPTSPLRHVDDINGAISMYRDMDADSVISIREQYHPTSWLKEIDERNRFCFDEGLPLHSNRQDLPTRYLPNGAIYILKRELIFGDSWYSQNSYGYLMDTERSIDVDTSLDFTFAKCLAEKNGEKNVEK